MPRGKGKGPGRPRKPGRPKGSKNKRKKNIVVISQTKSGKNIKFKNTNTRKTMSLTAFKKRIKSGYYPDYHIRKTKRGEIPASNPDSSKTNNLG